MQNSRVKVDSHIQQFKRRERLYSIESYQSRLLVLVYLNLITLRTHRVTIYKNIASVHSKGSSKASAMRK